MDEPKFRLICSSTLNISKWCCDYLMNECRKIVENKNKRRKRCWCVKPWSMRCDTLGASVCYKNGLVKMKEMFRNNTRISEEQLLVFLTKVAMNIRKFTFDDTEVRGIQTPCRSECACFNQHHFGT
jgi:hypothetical protein